MTDDGSGLFIAGMMAAICLPFPLVIIIRRIIENLIVPESQLDVGLFLISMYLMITWIALVIGITIKVTE